MGDVVNLFTGKIVTEHMSLMQLIKHKWYAGEYEQGRHSFWYVFDLPDGKRTFSSVEMLSIIESN